jgi:hypothetical protein
MPNWLIVSIVGSVVLTVLLNLLPMLFPKTARRAQERMIEEIHKQHDWEDDAGESLLSVEGHADWLAGADCAHQSHWLVCALGPAGLNREALEAVSRR